ncbi:hypothetical protein VP284E431_P0021 [Vibrio phage 284E43-1]|nr:hypothetical protein VP284E431_P0021 [Vibrio phage 284E43-1]
MHKKSPTNLAGLISRLRDRKDNNRSRHVPTC